MPFLAPIIGGIGAAIGAVGSFLGGSGVLAILGRVAVGIGLNYAAGLLRKKPEETAAATSRQIGGVRLDHEYGGDVGRTVACGLVGIAGHDVHVNTFGPSNGWLQQVYTLSDYFSDGLSRAAINGSYVTLGAPADPQKGY